MLIPARVPRRGSWLYLHLLLALEPLVRHSRQRLCRCANCCSAWTLILSALALAAPPEEVGTRRSRKRRSAHDAEICRIAVRVSQSQTKCDWSTTTYGRSKTLLQQQEPLQLLPMTRLKLRPCSLMLCTISERLRGPPPPMSSLQSPVIPSLFPILLLPLIPSVPTICIPLRPVPPCPLFFPIFICFFFAFKVNVFLTYQFLHGVPHVCSNSSPFTKYWNMTTCSLQIQHTISYQVRMLPLKH